MINVAILKKPYIIIIFAIIGALVGIYYAPFAIYIKPLGEIFVSLLKMLVVPIILFGIVVSVAKLGESANIKKLAVSILLSIVLLSTISGFLGAFLSVLFNFGSTVDANIINSLSASNPAPNTENFKFVTVLDFIKALIPQNPFKALTEGNLLQVLFFSIILGLSLAYINNSNKSKILASLDLINDALINIINIIMYLAPFGVFSLMAYLTASLGANIFYDTIKLILLVIFGLFIWLYVGLGLVVVFFTNLKYTDFIKKIIPLQIMAFSTSSSLASLPVNIKTCTNLNLKPNIFSLVLPIGAVMNMGGSSLFYAASVVFCAQLFNIDLTLASIIAIVVVGMLGSIATPGIPGLSLSVIMVMIIAGVPLIALPIIIAVDRVLDMFITIVNVVSDTVVSAIVSKYN